jgi:hypothetical protein
VEVDGLDVAATPRAVRSAALMRPSWFASVTTSGASSKMPLWFRSSMTATVMVVSTSLPRIGAPTIQVSQSSVSLAFRFVTPVRLKRLARLVPGPWKPGRSALVVDPRTNADRDVAAARGVTRAHHVRSPMTATR